MDNYIPAEDYSQDVWNATKFQSHEVAIFL